MVIEKEINKRELYSVVKPSIDFGLEWVEYYLDDLKYRNINTRKLLLKRKITNPEFLEFHKCVPWFYNTYEEIIINYYTKKDIPAIMEAGWTVSQELIDLLEEEHERRKV